ncbi:MAG TPA: hypothetical protein VMW38_02460 [Terriglobia bacterium]|nr:hypothetical protein [Terriglobia bacterium]
MKKTLFFLLMGFVLPAYSQTTKLSPEALKGFNEYVRMTEESLSKRWAGQKKFLRVYDNPRDLEQVRKGEVVVEQLTSNKSVHIKGGIVHDWVGAMFIPEIHVKTVLGILQDFNRHKEIYPEVIDSRLTKQEGNTFWFYLKLKKKKILTVVLNTKHEARYYQAGTNRWYCRSYSLKIAEVSDAGSPEEHERPVGEDHGFLWRLYAYWHLDEVKEGVFVECRTLSLSRDVPYGLGWLIHPIINELPGESLKETLESTRKAALESLMTK